MSENRRQLLKDAMDNKETYRIPMGFWHHFVLGKDQFQGLERPELLDKIVEGHKRYFETIEPDMMKLMNEGFMGYPPVMNNNLETAEDLLAIKSIGPDHPWITEQVKHVRRLVDLFGDKVMTFYNVFAPLQVIRIRLDFYDLKYDRFVYLAEHFPEELHKAGMEIQKDIMTLVSKLLTETKLDGIYYCVQNIQSKMYDRETYDRLIRPTEIGVLETANKLSDYNILHICGYAHHKNNLSWYQDYEAKAYNWATFTEGVTIEEGRRLFPGKCVLGGFDNNPQTLIDSGSEEEVCKFVDQLIKENGHRGYIMGADCSIPNNINDGRIHWISRQVKEKENCMKDDRKAVIDAFLNNETEERVPAAFWHHFVSFHNHYSGADPEIYNTVVAEQKKYIDEVKPDFLKIMSDGFFGHPSVCRKTITSVEDLDKVESVGPDHPWITKQVEYVKEICEHAGDDVYKYYNIFSPLQYIRLRFEEYDEDFKKFVRLFHESPEVMEKAARCIAEDTKILVKKLFEETSIDGIYYSVQCVQDKMLTHAGHKKLVEPLDLDVLNYINEFSNKTILHICGYGKYTNNLSWYKDYPVAAYNWAVYSENITLGEGKKILGDKPVIGGFDNAAGSILYTGTEEELRAEIKKILDEAGTKGVAIGADCTISSDSAPERLELIRKIAAEYTK